MSFWRCNLLHYPPFKEAAGPPALHRHARLLAGGTTIAGVHELEKAGVRAAFINAVLGAANRADEMAKM